VPIGDVRRRRVDAQGLRDRAPHRGRQALASDDALRRHRLGFDELGLLACREPESIRIVVTILKELRIENVTPTPAWVERGWREVERETVLHVVSLDIRD